MKTLGIIGGLGPESTLDYYQRIIALFRERTGHRHYPEFLIVSVDLRKGLDFMDANDLSGMANYLLEASTNSRVRFRFRNNLRKHASHCVR